MGARARTLIYVRSSLPLDEIHDDGNGPSWSMLVVVNYHVSRTPTSPFSPVPVVVQFAIADLHRETSDFTPTNLAALPLFFFLSPHDRDFLLLLLLLVDFRPVPLVDTFDVALIARFFFHGKWAQLVRSVKNARGTQYPTIKTPFLLFQLRIEFNGDATMFESLERTRDGQKFVNTAIYEVTEKLLFLFSFSGPVAQWISRE